MKVRKRPTKRMVTENLVTIHSTFVECYSDLIE